MHKHLSCRATTCQVPGVRGSGVPRAGECVIQIPSTHSPFNWRLMILASVPKPAGAALSDRSG